MALTPVGGTVGPPLGWLLDITVGTPLGFLLDITVEPPLGGYSLGCYGGGPRGVYWMLQWDLAWTVTPHCHLAFTVKHLSFLTHYYPF